MRFAGSGPVGGVEFLPAAQELADDRPAGVDDAESRDVHGAVFLHLVVPTVVHDLHVWQKKRSFSSIPFLLILILILFLLT